MTENYDSIFDLIGTTIKTETIVKFEIKNNTVYGYTGNVECLVLPDIATKIHDYAFANHAELKKVCIGKSTKKIGKGAFKECRNLEEIIWSDSITHIDDEAFMGCVSLKRIIFPNSLKEIGNSAFEHCIRLEDVIFPKSLQTIGLVAFKETAINHVEIPEKVKLVCYGAFVYCKNLDTITILYDTPQSKKRMEDKGLDWVYSSSYAFKVPKSKGGWSPEWNYKTNYQGYTSRYSYVFKRVEGDFIIDDYSSNILSRYIGAGGDIEVPESIDTVSEYALFNNSNITSITFNSRMKIEKNAFAFASSLKKVVFKAGISVIDVDAFSFCKNLRHVIIEDEPHGYGTIEKHSFGNCAQLTDVKISEAVRSIDCNAFEDCPCKVEPRFGYWWN